MKELRCEDGEEDVFQKEIEAWRQAAGNALHPHLIQLLATWRQSQVWNLLLPWADGNLWDFYEKHPDPQPDISKARWMIEQLLGLAGALQRIHRNGSNDFETRVWGIHGDIKPENILWYKDNANPNSPGKFVICDFGFTRFHSRASRSKAHSEGRDLKYRAPEQEQGAISRAYDMWSFGCVLLEFVTWYLAGHKHVEDTFCQRRQDDDKGEMFTSDKFFNFDHNHQPCKKASVEKVRYRNKFQSFYSGPIDYMDFADLNTVDWRSPSPPSLQYFVQRSFGPDKEGAFCYRLEGTW